MTQKTSPRSKTRAKKRSVEDEQAELERNATFGEPPATSGREGVVRCYNRACPDYRRDRKIGEPCGCTERRRSA